MSIYESISSALLGIWGNKMRAVFTMFGIIVGISSVIMITSIGDGFRNTINAQFESLGLDEINISTTNQTRPVEPHERLTLNDADFLRNNNELMVVSATYSETIDEAVDVIGSSDKRSITLNGVDEYASMLTSNPELIHGRHIVAQDLINASNVIIIDEFFSNMVFGTDNSVGQSLNVQTPVGNQTFTVIGVTEEQTNSQFALMFDLPFEVQVPITVVQDMYNVGSVVESITVRIEDTDNIPQIGNQTIRLLELRNNAEDIYQMFSMSFMIAQVDSVIGLFTLFLSLVASISLLVGGIGVMNIMLVSVTERTREIGIRKSLGATNAIIQFQFLLEASMLTAVGGVLGIIIGYIGSVIISSLAGSILGMDIIPTISFTAIAVITLLSTLIGIVFGVYPAAKASKLDPVESLRFE